VTGFDLQVTAKTLLNALQNPATNSRLAATAIAALVVFVLLVAVAFALFFPRKTRTRTVIRYYPAGAAPESDGPVAAESATQGERAAENASPDSDSVESAEEDPESRPPSRALLLLGSALIPALLIASVVAGYVATGTNDFCVSSCHLAQPQVVYAVESSHANCVACHEASPVAGFVPNVIDRARMAVTTAVPAGKSGAPSRVPVDSSRCMACHKGIDQKVVVVKAANVRMKHAEPLAAGMTCVECHGSVGHEAPDTVHKVKMSKCLTCHDGTVASAKCDTCHTSDVSLAGREAVSVAASKSSALLGSGKYSFPAVVVANTDCGGCHDMKNTCDKCHGLHMPHSDSFIEGYHAKEAAWEKKKLCYRCHSKTDCGSCHQNFDGGAGHAPGWKQEHRRSPWDSGCSCHDRGKNIGKTMCIFCHDNAPTDKVNPLPPKIRPPADLKPPGENNWNPEY